MNKQQAWEEWARPITGSLVTALDTSSHGRAFSAGWDAAMAAKRDRPVNSKQEDYPTMSSRQEKKHE